MSHKFYTEKLHHLSSGLADPLLCKIYDALRTSDSVLTEQNKWIIPYASLTTGDILTDRCPPIIAVGSQSSQREWFTSEWADSVCGGGDTPDPELEEMCVDNYRQVASGVPYYGIGVFDGQKSPCSHLGTPYLTVERMIWPIRFTKTGPIFCAYMGIPLGQA